VIWVETTELAWANKIKEIASHTGYKSHWGKFLP
jgi:hypothetical protein